MNPKTAKPKTKQLVASILYTDGTSCEVPISRSSGQDVVNDMHQKSQFLFFAYQGSERVLCVNRDQMTEVLFVEQEV